MAFNAELQLDLPDEFPAQAFAHFMGAARGVLLVPATCPSWKEFGGASNLIGFRFRASKQEMMAFIESWLAHGENVSFEEVFHRERALFTMFSCGVSCIESACYALHALASHPALLGVPFGPTQQRYCTPKKLHKVLLKHTKGRPLADSLGGIIASPDWSFWVDLRNRMTHRTNLPRILHGAVGFDPKPVQALLYAETSSTPAFAIDVPILEATFSWLTQSLGKLLSEGSAFAKSAAITP